MSIQRLTAQILDVIIYYILSFIPFFIIATIATLIITTDKNSETLKTISSVIMFLGVISLPIFYIFLTARHLKSQSATLGYRMMKLKTIQRNGQNLTDKQCVARAIIKLFLLPLMFTYIVTAIHGMIMFQTKGESDLVDRIMNTHAVKI